MNNVDSDSEEELGRARRVLRKKVDNYELMIEGFHDWSRALMDLEIGSNKIRLFEMMKPIYDKNGNLLDVTFSWKLDNTRDRILIVLYLQYPRGISQDTLQSIVGAPTKTVRNWLTESSKGIADNLQRIGDDYSIKSNSFSWARKEADEILGKLQ